MASLALKAIAYGADKIPDKFFESIPGGYYKPKEEKERERRDRRKHRKDRDSKDKRRSHSEGRHRKRSPSPSDTEYDQSDYPETDEESDHDRRRSRRRGRDRDRDRAHDKKDRTTALAEEEEFLELPPPKNARSKSLGRDNRPYYPPHPKLDTSQPAPGAPPVQVRPFENGEHSPYRPYNPAEYASGPMGVRPPPPVATSPQNGYYSPQNQSPATTTFPVRTSRASSVDSRGQIPAPYIPHANVYQPQQPSYSPSAYATAAGSPYSTSSHSTVPTPAYVPQTSSPYNPGYSAAYAPVPHGYATQPVSRHGSVSQHSAVPAVPAGVPTGYVSQPVTRQGSVNNGGSGGGGGSRHSSHHQRREHDLPEHHRRHSVGFQGRDPRIPIRPRGSSNVSHAGSLNGNAQNRFESLPEHFDGINEAYPYHHGGVGAPIGNTVRGSSDWEAGRKSEQRRRHRDGRPSRHTRY
ncbi:hypothetical protein K490DRAFT_70043 [Saccharata proteae CBS 121410]|uniref:Uncharacterized protein n=1 Tax=Saccharata proteae CBS 121410 TaxID=1314787 RepID=A0A9P4LSY4_9PEZI|nr:hypothetical protein K490DRAFT_70043 [Saccharata proteae CBS 121410]